MKKEGDRLPSCFRGFARPQLSSQHTAMQPSLTSSPWQHQAPRGNTTIHQAPPGGNTKLLRKCCNTFHLAKAWVGRATFSLSGKGEGGGTVGAGRTFGKSELRRPGGTLSLVGAGVVPLGGGGGRRKCPPAPTVERHDGGNFIRSSAYSTSHKRDLN